MRKIFYSLILFIFNCQNAISLEMENLGNGILFFKSNTEIMIDFLNKRNIQYTSDDLDYVKNIDLDGDGVSDEVFVTAFDKSTRFKKNVRTIDILSSKNLINKPERNYKFSGYGRGRPSYALVIVLSTKNKTYYLLNNRVFFPYLNQKRILLGTSKADKEKSDWLSVSRIIEKTGSNPAKGDAIGISGCVPNDPICNYVVSIYWDGSAFKTVWLSVLGD